MIPHSLLWQSLQSAHPRRGGRQPTTWTRADVTACLASWAAEHGRPPYSSELGPRHQLPGYGTIALACGSVEGVYAALGWPYHRSGYRDGPGGRPPLGAVPAAVGNRECLCCETWFESEEPRHIRVCARCKQSELWTDTGAWMAGVLVP